MLKQAKLLHVPTMHKDAPKKSIRFADLTFGDAQAGLWDAMLPGEAILPILGRASKVGLESIEVLTPAVFLACVNRLHEDPWERVRLAAERATHTKIAVLTRGRFGFGSRPLATPVLEAMVERLAGSGARRHVVYDPVNDITQLARTLHVSRAQGLETSVALVYSIAPYSTPSQFASWALQAVELGADSVCLYDPAAVLTPDAAVAVLAALRDGLDCPIELRTNASTGLAEVVCLRAVSEGLVDVVHTACLPAAGDGSYPPLDYFVEHLTRMGHLLEVAAEDASALSDYVAAIMERRGLPRGQHGLHDRLRLRHQMPPSVLERYRTLLNDRLQAEWLTTVAELAEQLGRPPMSEPIASVVGEQAFSAVRGFDTDGATMSTDFRRLVLGGFGKLPGEVCKDLVDRASAERTAHEIAADRSPVSTVLGTPDDLLRLLCPVPIVDAFFSDRSKASLRLQTATDAQTPIIQLMDELTRYSDVRKLNIRKGDWSLEFSAADSKKG